MDPNKLAAFRDSKPQGQGPHPKGKQPNQQQPQQGKQKPQGGDGGGGEDEGGDGESDDDMQEGGEGKFGEFIPVLEQHASEIEDLTDEIDRNALTDFDSDLEENDEQAMQEGLDRLPDDFKQAFQAAIGAADGMTEDEARKLGEHLAQEDIITVDPDIFAGWLFHASKIV